MISVFDLFSVGIGPSSSHTVGPMRAARAFVEHLCAEGLLPAATRVTVELEGSLAATGQGHGTPGAIVLGLMGQQPETVDPQACPALIDGVAAAGTVVLAGHRIGFDVGADVIAVASGASAHPNGMTFIARADTRELTRKKYYSIGGGFVLEADALGEHAGAPAAGHVPHPFRTAAELMAICDATGLTIAEVVLANELTWRSESEIRSGLMGLWAVMQECVANGIGAASGELPGGLRVPRRAPGLRRKLLAEPGTEDPLRGMDWVSLYALAVNEENAAGGRVVTAPTNGAAGIIPAVMHYYWNFVPGADEAGIQKFLLTAAAIGVLFKSMASISGAEVGCQGEVGSACSMAAGGMAAVLGADPHQVENAAEIGMEHNLGLTCDPIGGLVQIPCIERNAIAAIKAISAARTALYGDGRHIVSLDKVIATMRETGADMMTKYKETSLGGLAVNVIEC